MIPAQASVGGVRVFRRRVRFNSDVKLPGPLTVEEIVEAAARRAERGERQPVGFGFTSMAPSPLKERAAHDQIQPDADAEVDKGFDLDDITARLEAARVRLKRAAATAHDATSN